MAREIFRGAILAALLLAAAVRPSAAAGETWDDAAGRADWTACDLDSKDYDTVVAACTRLLQRKPPVPTEIRASALVVRSNAYAYGPHPDSDRAIADLDQASRLQPANGTIFGMRGEIYSWFKHDYDHAIADFTQAIRIDAKDWSSIDGRGDAWEAKGEHDRAIADYTTALALVTPDKAWTIYYTRGDVFARKGDFPRAVADFTASLAINPQSAQALRDRGVVREALHDLPGALADIDAAHALAPADTTIAEVQARLRTALAAAQPAAPARVAAIPVGGRRVALVIGNGHYAAQRALPNPPTDAADIATALARLGFAVTRLNDADYNQMRIALRDFARAAPAADIAFVYYAGHGIELNGENYLIPVDAELKRDTDASAEAIPLHSVMDAVENAHVAGLIVLDACRENPFDARIQLSAGHTRGVSRGLGRVEPSGNLLVAYAAREGTLADDGDGRNSPFTAALLRHLDQPGTEIRLLFGEVRDDVMQATHGKQQPVTRGELGGTPVYLRQ